MNTENDSIRKKEARSYDVYEKDQAVKTRSSYFVDWRSVSTLPRSRGKKVSIPTYFRNI